MQHTQFMQQQKNIGVEVSRTTWWYIYKGIKGILRPVPTQNMRFALWKHPIISTLYFPNIYIFWLNLARQDGAVFWHNRWQVKNAISRCALSRESVPQCWVQTWRARIPWSKPRSPGRTCDDCIFSYLSSYFHLSYRWLSLIRGWYWPEQDGNASLVKCDRPFVLQQLL